MSFTHWIISIQQEMTELFVTIQQNHVIPFWPFWNCYTRFISNREVNQHTDRFQGHGHKFTILKSHKSALQRKTQKSATSKMAWLKLKVDWPQEIDLNHSIHAQQVSPVHIFALWPLLLSSWDVFRVTMIVKTLWDWSLVRKLKKNSLTLPI